MICLRPFVNLTHISVFPLLCDLVLESCDEIWYSGNGAAQSNYYTIDIDGSGPLQPFPVYCNFSAETPTTIVHHDKEQRQSTGRTSSNSSPYSVSISYRNNGVFISTDKVSALVDMFEKCYYHYKHECTENILTESGWLFRNGTESKNWNDICNTSMCLYLWL